MYGTKCSEIVDLENLRGVWDDVAWRIIGVITDGTALFMFDCRFELCNLSSLISIHEDLVNFKITILGTQTD